jgi:hypothetical protein
LLHPGPTVVITARIKHVAKGCILFVGNIDSLGEVKKFRTLLVGVGKALMQIAKVIKGSCEVPFGYECEWASGNCYKARCALGELQEQYIVTILI